MTNALAVYEQMTALQSAATALHASGYFGDVKTQAQAMVKVMAGAEIGLPPFAAMTGIHIINGKPTLGANLIATLVKNDPRYDYRVKVANNEQCILTWYEGGQPVGESSFTMAEANAAGLTNKATWKAYASDMLFARALTRGARRYAPGIFGGAPVYTPEEVGADLDHDGNVIEAEIVQVAPPRVVQSEPPVVYDTAEGEIAKASPRQFVSVAARLLEDSEQAVKDRLKALGYGGIPQADDKRIAMYHKLAESYNQNGDHPALFDTPLAGNGAYEE